MANWINKQVQNATAAAGNAAGGVVNSFGNGVTNAGFNVGNGISNASRGWGNAARDYGNGIKDATKASGPRQGSASNPLGLAKSPTSVRLENQRKTVASKPTGRDHLGISGKF